MIDFNEFTEGFETVVASFSRTISKRNITLWFQEIKHLDSEIFKKTCHQLKRGERFPNFGDFFQVYHSIKGQPVNASTQDYKTDGNNAVPPEAVRALFKIFALGNFDVADITPNEAIELAEGLEDMKYNDSGKEKLRSDNIWKSEKTERIGAK